MKEKEGGGSCHQPATRFQCDALGEPSRLLHLATRTSAETSSQMTSASRLTPLQCAILGPSAASSESTSRRAPASATQCRSLGAARQPTLSPFATELGPLSALQSVKQGRNDAMETDAPTFRPLASSRELSAQESHRPSQRHPPFSARVASSPLNEYASAAMASAAGRPRQKSADSAHDDPLRRSLQQPPSSAPPSPPCLTKSLRKRHGSQLRTHPLPEDLASRPLRLLASPSEIARACSGLGVYFATSRCLILLAALLCVLSVYSLSSNAAAGVITPTYELVRRSESSSGPHQRRTLAGDARASTPVAACAKPWASRSWITRLSAGANCAEAAYASPYDCPARCLWDGPAHVAGAQPPPPPAPRVPVAVGTQPLQSRRRGLRSESAASEAAPAPSSEACLAHAPCNTVESVAQCCSLELLPEEPRRIPSGQLPLLLVAHVAYYIGLLWILAVQRRVARAGLPRQAPSKTLPSQTKSNASRVAVHAFAGSAPSNALSPRPSAGPWTRVLPLRRPSPAPFAALVHRSAHRWLLFAGSHAPQAATLSPEGIKACVEDWAAQFGPVAASVVLPRAGAALQVAQQLTDARRRLEESDAQRALKPRRNVLARWLARAVVLECAGHAALAREAERLELKLAVFERSALRPSGDALVFFERAEDAGECAREGRLALFGRSVSGRSLGKIAGGSVVVQRAPEPSDVLWTRLGLTRWELAARRATSLIATIVIMAGGAAAQYGLCLLAERERQKRIAAYHFDGPLAQGMDWASVASLASSLLTTLKLSVVAIITGLVIVLINQAITWAARRLCTYERWPTRTQLERWLVFRLSLCWTINACAIPLVAARVAGSESAWFARGGVVESACYTQIANAVLVPVGTLLGSPGELLAPWTARLAATQAAADSMLEAPQFALAETVAGAVLTLALAFWWGPVLPLSMFLALVGLLFAHLADKIVALRRSARPPDVAAAAFGPARAVLRLLPLVQLVLVRWVYFASQPGVEAVFWAGLALWVAALCLPLRALSLAWAALLRLFRRRGGEAPHEGENPSCGSLPAQAASVLNATPKLTTLPALCDACLLKRSGPLEAAACDPEEVDAAPAPPPPSARRSSAPSLWCCRHAEAHAALAALESTAEPAKLRYSELFGKDELLGLRYGPRALPACSVEFAAGLSRAFGEQIPSARPEVPAFDACLSSMQRAERTEPGSADGEGATPHTFDVPTPQSVGVVSPAETPVTATRREPRKRRPSLLETVLLAGWDWVAGEELPMPASQSAGVHSDEGGCA